MSHINPFEFRNRLSMTIMIQEEVKSEYDNDWMSTCSDENTPLQIHPIHESGRLFARITIFVLILGNFMFCAVYIDLRIRYARLQYEFNGLQPELFPCK